MIWFIVAPLVLIVCLITLWIVARVRKERRIVDQLRSLKSEFAQENERMRSDSSYVVHRFYVEGIRAVLQLDLLDVGRYLRYDEEATGLVKEALREYSLMSQNLAVRTGVLSARGY